jgi:hypothetical protein
VGFYGRDYGTSKKMLKFTKMLKELKLYQQNSYHYVSAISYQYPSRMSSPINLSSVGSMNIGNNSVSKSLTNESNSNNQGITREELIKIQLYARATDWFQSRNWSSPYGYWWEHKQACRSRLTLNDIAS